MLAPLIKMLINNNVGYQELDKIIQQSYVEVAEREFRLPSKKQSFSRIALLTGMSRKDVQKILSQTEAPSKFRQNSALSVVSAWASDPRYKNKSLPIEGDLSFSSLVTEFSGDIPVRATLDELLRVGCVERNDNNEISLLRDVYIPEGSVSDKLEMITESARDLFSSGEHNLSHTSPEDRLQLFVAYQGLTEKAVKKFKKMSDRKSMALLKEYDAWLRKQEPADVEGGDSSHRVGVGMYFFEEPCSEALADDKPKEEMNSELEKTNKTPDKKTPDE